MSDLEDEISIRERDHPSAIADLEHRLASKQKQVCELLSYIDDLETQLPRSQASPTSVSSSHANLAIGIERDHSALLAGFDKELDVVVDDNRALHLRVTELEAKEQQLARQCARMQDQLTDRTSSLSEKSRECEELRSELGTIKPTLRSQSEQIDCLTKEVYALEQELPKTNVPLEAAPMPEDEREETLLAVREGNMEFQRMIEEKEALSLQLEELMRLLASQKEVARSKDAKARELWRSDLRTVSRRNSGLEAQLVESLHEKDELLRSKDLALARMSSLASTRLKQLIGLPRNSSRERESHVDNEKLALVRSAHQKSLAENAKALKEIQHWKALANKKNDATSHANDATYVSKQLFEEERRKSRELYIALEAQKKLRLRVQKGCNVDSDQFKIQSRELEEKQHLVETLTEQLALHTTSDHNQLHECHKQAEINRQLLLHNDQLVRANVDRQEQFVRKRNLLLKHQSSMCHECGDVVARANKCFRLLETSQAHHLQALEDKNAELAEMDQRLAGYFKKFQQQEVELQAKEAEMSGKQILEALEGANVDLRRPYPRHPNWQSIVPHFAHFSVGSQHTFPDASPHFSVGLKALAQDTTNHRYRPWTVQRSDDIQHIFHVLAGRILELNHFQAESIEYGEALVAAREMKDRFQSLKHAIFLEHSPSATESLLNIMQLVTRGMDDIQQAYHAKESIPGLGTCAEKNETLDNETCAEKNETRDNETCAEKNERNPGCSTETLCEHESISRQNENIQNENIPRRSTEADIDILEASMRSLLHEVETCLNDSNQPVESIEDDTFSIYTSHSGDLLRKSTMEFNRILAVLREKQEELQGYSIPDNRSEWDECAQNSAGDTRSADDTTYLVEEIISELTTLLMSWLPGNEEEACELPAGGGNMLDQFLVLMKRKQDTFEHMVRENMHKDSVIDQLTAQLKDEGTEAGTVDELESRLALEAGTVDELESRLALREAQVNALELQLSLTSPRLVEPETKIESPVSRTEERAPERRVSFQDMLEVHEYHVAEILPDDSVECEVTDEVTLGLANSADEITSDDISWEEPVDEIISQAGDGVVVQVESVSSLESENAQLRQEIEMHVSDSHKWDRKLKDTEEEVAQLKGKIDEYLKTVDAQWEEKLVVKDEEKNVLVAQLNAQQEEIEALGGKVKARQVEVAALEGVAAWQGEILALEEQFSARQEAAAVLEGEVQARQEEIEALGGQLLSRQGEVAALDGQVRSLQAVTISQGREVNALQEELEALGRQALARKGELIALEEQLLARQDDLNVRQEELGALEGESATRKGAAAALEEQAFARREQSLALQEELTARQVELGALEAELATRQREVATLEEQSLARQGELITLGKQVLARQGDLDALEGDFATRQGEAAALERQVLARHGELIALEEQALARQGDLDALEGESATRQGEVGALGKQAAARQLELISLEEHVLARQGDLNALEAEAAARRGEAAALEGQVVARHGELYALEEQVLSRQVGLDALDGESSTRQVEADVMAKQAVARQRELIALGDQVVARQGDLDALEGEASARQGEAAALEGQVIARHGELIALEEQMAARQGDLDALEGESSTRQDEAEALGKQAVARQRELISLEEQVLARRRDLDAIGGEAATRQEEAAALEAQAIARQGELIALGEQALARQGDLAALEGESAMRQEEAAALAAEKFARQQELATLEGEINATRRGLAALEQQVATRQEEVATLEATSLARQGEIAELTLQARTDRNAQLASASSENEELRAQRAHEGRICEALRDVLRQKEVDVEAFRCEVAQLQSQLRMAELRVCEKETEGFAILDEREHIWEEKLRANELKLEAMAEAKLSEQVAPSSFMEERLEHRAEAESLAQTIEQLREELRTATENATSLTVQMSQKGLRIRDMQQNELDLLRRIKGNDDRTCKRDREHTEALAAAHAARTSVEEGTAPLRGQLLRAEEVAESIWEEREHARAIHEEELATTRLALEAQVAATKLAENKFCNRAAEHRRLQLGLLRRKLDHMHALQQQLDPQQETDVAWRTELSAKEHSFAELSQGAEIANPRESEANADWFAEIEEQEKRLGELATGVDACSCNLFALSLDAKVTVVAGLDARLEELETQYAVATSEKAEMEALQLCAQRDLEGVTAQLRRTECDISLLKGSQVSIERESQQLQEIVEERDCQIARLTADKEDMAQLAHEKRTRDQAARLLESKMEELTCGQEDAANTISQLEQPQRADVARVAARGEDQERPQQLAWDADAQSPGNYMAESQELAASQAAEITSLRNTVRSLTTQSLSANNEVARLTCAVAGKDLVVETLTKELGAKRAPEEEISGLRAQVADLRQTLDERVRHYTHLLQAAEVNTQGASEKLDEVERLRASLDACRTDLAGKDAEMETLRIAAGGMAKLAEENQQELADVKAIVEGFAAREQEKSLELEDLRRSLVAERKEMKRLTQGDGVTGQDELMVQLVEARQAEQSVCLRRRLVLLLQGHLDNALEQVREKVGAEPRLPDLELPTDDAAFIRYCDSLLREHVRLMNLLVRNCGGELTHTELDRDARERQMWLEGEMERRTRKIQSMEDDLRRLSYAKDEATLALAAKADCLSALSSDICSAREEAARSERAEYFYHTELKQLSNAMERTQGECTTLSNELDVRRNQLEWSENHTYGLYQEQGALRSEIDTIRLGFDNELRNFNAELQGVLRRKERMEEDLQGLALDKQALFEELEEEKSALAVLHTSYQRANVYATKPMCLLRGIHLREQRRSLLLVWSQWVQVVSERLARAPSPSRQDRGISDEDPDVDATPTAVNFKVVVRCRPCASGKVGVDITDHEVRIPAEPYVRETLGKTFHFDQAYSSVSQDSLYHECVEPLVHDVLEGYNATVMCYGQTGSGKTYTIEGPMDLTEAKSGNSQGRIGSDAYTMTHVSHQRGILPRIFQTFFQHTPRPVIRLGHIEIYNETVRDVLNEDKSPKIREHNGEVFIKDLTWAAIESMDDFFQIMHLARRRREVFATRENPNSSRSHCIFICQVATPCKNICGTIHIVDLAGSEKSDPNAVSSMETRHINKSLATLGNVVNALSAHKDHVPYRDSKLSRVLQDGLGGNSKTLIILNCVKDMDHSYETRSTLRFGERARSITNYVKINRTRKSQPWRQACPG